MAIRSVVVHPFFVVLFFVFVFSAEKQATIGHPLRCVSKGRLANITQYRRVQGLDVAY